VRWGADGVVDRVTLGSRPGYVPMLRNNQLQFETALNLADPHSRLARSGDRPRHTSTGLRAHQHNRASVVKGGLTIDACCRGLALCFELVCRRVVVMSRCRVVVVVVVVAYVLVFPVLVFVAFGRFVIFVPCA
jgi:hypothetical protein